MCDQRGRLGIFSRDHHNKYRWLSRSLEGSSAVTSVQCHYITNRFADFRDEVRGCTVAVLYHSKTHGRLNVTDVTDSLYEDELRHLHDTLGKNNVIVVIDDVEDNSDLMKQEILRQQPSIGRLARDLFLFGGEDRRTSIGEDTEEDSLITSNTKEEKLGQILALLRAHNRGLWCHNCFRPACLVIALLVGLLVVVGIGVLVYVEERH